MVLWFAVSLLFRRRFQFSLSSLLVLVVTVAIACSWLTVKMQQAREQREVLEVVWSAGGDVNYDCEYDADRQFVPNVEMPGPAWLRKSLGGVDFFADIVAVGSFGIDNPTEFNLLPHLSHRLETRAAFTPTGSFDDETVEHLKRLPKLDYLHLFGSEVTDAGMEHVGAMPHLKHLTHSSVPTSDGFSVGITDVGLERLTRAGGLRSLHLGTFYPAEPFYDRRVFGRQVHITDAGLEHLKRLTQLEELTLMGTHITDAGLEHLGALKNLQMLNLRGNWIGDAGLQHLESVPSLQRLDLTSTDVTYVGVAKLREALPECDIDW